MSQLPARLPAAAPDLAGAPVSGWREDIDPGRVLIRRSPAGHQRCPAGAQDQNALIFEVDSCPRCRVQESFVIRVVTDQDFALRVDTPRSPGLAEIARTIPPE